VEEEKIKHLREVGRNEIQRAYLLSKDSNSNPTIYTSNHISLSPALF
jgi:hypothetical protein